jgi:2-polyprenyl-3-methyl-5-hydroxy-6-metoxy-1,4-benzoquinol methylase
MNESVPVTCPICEASAAERDSDLHLHWCAACRHLFTKLPKTAQETYGESYFDEAHKRWFENPEYGLFARVERAILPVAGSRPIRLLDVGCGRGDFLKWLRPRHPDWHLTGIDLAPNQHPDIEFIQGDVATAPLAGPYDIVLTFMVVEHLEEIRPFFAKMRSLLADGGLLMVNTFNNDSLIFRIARAFKRLGLSSAAYRRLYSPHHLQHYSRRSIREILVRSGFEIQEHRCHNYPLRAVDVPAAGRLVELVYRAFVGVVFLVSEPLGLGIEHTVFCRPAPRV